MAFAFSLAHTHKLAFVLPREADVPVGYLYVGSTGEYVSKEMALGNMKLKEPLKAKKYQMAAAFRGIFAECVNDESDASGACTLFMAKDVLVLRLLNVLHV